MTGDVGATAGALDVGKTCPIGATNMEGMSIFGLIAYVMALMYMTTEQTLKDQIKEYEQKMAMVEQARAERDAMQTQIDAASGVTDTGLEYDMYDVDGDGIDDMVIDLGGDQFLVLKLDKEGNVVEPKWDNSVTGIYSSTDGVITTADKKDKTDAKISTTEEMKQFFAGERDIVNSSGTKLWVDGNDICFSHGSEGLVVGMNGTDGDATVDTSLSGFDLDDDHIDNNLHWATGELYGTTGQQEYDESILVDGWAAQKLIMDDPAYQAYCEANGLDAADPDALSAYINAPVSEGGLGGQIAVGVNGFEDTAWMENYVAMKDDEIDGYVSTDQLDMIYLQQSINQLNFIVTMWTNIIKTYYDGLQAIARNM
jgi:hypothetical protein